MHIKQITISNFRSFRDQQGKDLKPSFSAQTNAVIGRNGSGKSNLFDAVQFCLAAPPRFTNLRPEERQALLHEGSGSAAVNAYVEIVFDNSDQRFASVDTSSAGATGGGNLPDEVVLRRTVGLKKDEFFLQRKRCTKQEVQSLLEGAGFSKSNPYFIVQQGKVQDLCLMSDHERLALLKEVAGTTTYDDRKAESLAKMQDNQASIDKIGEVLQDIETRLQELQTERQELDAYQTQDRRRRAVEYSLYDQQWRKARTTLDALEEERHVHLQELRTVHDLAKETHDGIRSIEAQLSSQTAALRRHKQGPLALCKQERQAFQTKTTKLMLQVQEMEESVQTLSAEWQANEKELVSVNAKIQHAESILDESLEPQNVAAQQALDDMLQQRSEAQRKLQGLYAKQGRGRQFASRRERDAFLQTQLDDLEATRREKRQFLDEQRHVVLTNLRRNVIASEEQELTAHLQTVTTRSNALTELTKSLQAQQSQQLELHESRKAAQRVAATLQDSFRQARRDVHTALADFRKCLPRATAQGLAALETLVEQEGLIRGRHYWGMLLENITLQHSKYQTAVEVAAQNSLFHVICDTDETASKLMKRLEQGKLGRVTFLPLNTLRNVSENNNGNNRRLPDSLAKTDVCSLLDVCLQYDEALEAAMQHVFGGKLLCRTAELAAEWSTKLQTDAITLEGDLCGRKGALTGGYVDSTKSRMRAFAQKTQAQEALQNLQTQLDEAKNKASQVDQEANQSVQEVQRIEAKHAELTFLLQQEEGHVERLQTRLNLHRAQEENLVTTVLPPLERELETLQKDVDNLQEEMKTELAVTLSDQDREMMEQLKEVQKDLATTIADQKEVVAQAGLEVQKVKSLLQDNLFKRRDELIAGSGLAQKGNVNGQDGEDDDDDDDDDDNDGGDNAAATPARRRRQRQLQSSRRRGGSQATLSAAALLKQKQEDLQEAQQALDSAVALQKKAEERLTEARETEQELRVALHSAKNELEQLRSTDLQNAKALEEAQNKSDNLLTKVCFIYYFVVVFIFVYICCGTFTHPIIYLILFHFFFVTAIHGHVQSRDVCTQDSRIGFAPTTSGASKVCPVDH
jgi:structural maintenance of chromosome 3 (chondroitin sulfate proteoglycan 6)